MADTGNTLPRMGVILLDTRFKRPAGDIGNAETFGGRVLFETVQAASIDRVLRGDPRDPALGVAFRAARDRLVARGAGMITTSCGLLVFQQHQLETGCPVPVTTSSLFQVPLRIAQHGKVGIVGLLDGSITQDHLAAAGIPVDTPVGALADDAHLLDVLRADDPDRAIDPALAEADLIAAGRRLTARHPDLRAIVLECTNLPPYGPALARALGLPVYGFLDWLGAVDQGLARPDGRLPDARTTEIAQ